ncbi:hypothetical protein LOZ58_006438 [Ophidiomyces ophidiicola]|nr:hypothetical protein LOZ65_002330 [Ophidiomyces ophidiicola]KAI1936199.1 hypothetical protein LOZ66_004656 [Ophidiomyces ophidiicola]KAI1956361.1 hypothetical protein LOZ58_006438 [Ophidiomyces ophidiicola]
MAMAMAAHNGKSIDTLAVYSAALVKEPPRPGSGSSLTLFAASLVGFLCSAMNGYDGSLYNAMAANTAFLRYFDGSNTGIWAGIVSSMYQIGGIAALPFVGPVNDSLGRRAGMFAGAAVVIVGTVVSATVTVGNVRQFLGGRFLLGFGVSISSTAGPMYTVEVSHPAYRGIVTALLNTFWFIGSILASGTARACVRMGGTASWRAPLWMQLFFAGAICALALFLPESPRWLYVHKRRIQAQEMLVKYHGQGNPESEWVKLQLMEYEAHLDKNGADKRWWDYRVLFRNRVARYRTFCCCCVAVFGQWAGNAVLSYFMSAVLDAAGITGTIPHLNIILINSCQQFVWALLGACLVDRIGRRPLLVFSNAGCCVVWLCICITSSIFAGNGGTKDSPGTSPAAGTATLVFIFAFGAVFSIGFTPLQALYPVEMLSFEMRAKGMAFQSLVVNAGKHGVPTRLAK